MSSTTFSASPVRPSASMCTPPSSTAFSAVPSAANPSVPRAASGLAVGGVEPHLPRSATRSRRGPPRTRCRSASPSGAGRPPRAGPARPRAPPTSCCPSRVERHRSDVARVLPLARRAARRPCAGPGGRPAAARTPRTLPVSRAQEGRPPSAAICSTRRRPRRDRPNGTAPSTNSSSMAPESRR